MLFTNPLFMSETWMKVPDSKDFAIDLLLTLKETDDSETHKLMFDATIQLQQKIETPLVALSFFVADRVNLFWLSDASDVKQRRSSEYFYTQRNDVESSMLYFAVYDKS